MDKPFVDFYTDKKSIINEIYKYESDKYEIYDEEDEWNVILFVNKTEDINNFTDFLKERLGMSGNDLYDIIHEIWDNGHDTLGEMLDEETTDKIMLESENYILGK